MTTAFGCQAQGSEQDVDNNIYTVFQSRFPQDRAKNVIETDEGRGYSYYDLERESARYANFLTQLGIEPGDRVAVQVDKSPQTLFLYLGCLRAGCVYLPLNTAYTESEVAYFLGNAEPAVMVCRPQAHEKIAGLAADNGVNHVFTLDDRGEGSLPQQASQLAAEFDTVTCATDTLAVILYTSGTTGRPKGAMITHGNLAANGLALHEAWGWTQDDVLLHALPIFHIHGLFVACHCVLLAGGKMIFLRKFDVPAVKRLLPQATVFMGVPTYYTRLLADPGFDKHTCRTMRLFTCGSAPLLEQTFHAFQQRTGHTIVERYGMTETGMNNSNPLAGPRVAGTVGPALPGVSVRVVDDTGQPVPPGAVGQLQVLGKNVFAGYWRMPENTAKEFTSDGYFRTGDLAKADENNYIAIVGRDKDMIISGGLNIYPKEVEGLIDKLDGVAESAVIGVPHADFGEAVTTVVVRTPGGDDITETMIIQYLKEKLANYKIPKRVFFVDTLPRNTMGKVQKNRLREAYADTYER